MNSAAVVAVWLGFWAAGNGPVAASDQIEVEGPAILSPAEPEKTGLPLPPLDSSSLMARVPGLSDAFDSLTSNRKPEALKTIGALIKSESVSPADRHVIEYAVGRRLHDSRDCAAALDWYSRASAKESPVADWARFKHGQCLRTLKRYSQAADVLATVTADFADASYAARSRCLALKEQGSMSAFLSCAATYREVYGPDAKLLSEEAMSLEAGKKPREAALLWRQLLSLFPTSAEATKAEAALKGLTSQVGADGSLTHGESVLRAENLYGRHKFKDAIGVADKVLEKANKGSADWCRALGAKASSLAKSGNQTLSLPHFESLVADCSPHLVDTWLYRGCDAARAAGKPEIALVLLSELLKRFPESSLCDDSIVNTAFVLQRNGRAEEARELLRRGLKLYPKGDMASEAAWLLVYELYKAGKYKEVVAAADDFVSVLPEREDYRSDGRLQYWAARSQEKSKNKKDAIARYIEILKKYPLSWYALLAYQRLEKIRKGSGERAVREAAEASIPTLPDREDTLSGQGRQYNSHLVAGVALLSVGCTDEAAAEFKAAFTGTDAQEPHNLLLLAELYHRAGQFSYSHNILRRQLDEFGYSWPTEEDRRWWDVAYPVPFRDIITREGERQGVAWSLAMAITREESGFDPEIVSYAGAVGLMQLLPKTATHMAGKTMRPEQLKVPSANVPLGIKYLAHLDEGFQHPALVVAGYNSGPGGVAKTLDRYEGTEVDEFVEAIPFDQTRRYTKRVLSSAWRYQYIYGDNKGVIPFSMKFKRKSK